MPARRWRASITRWMSAASRASWSSSRLLSGLRLPLGLVAGGGLLPVAAVEQPARLHGLGVVIVETARVDAVILRIGTRLIEGVDAAMPAECVLRGAGVELIGRQRVGAAQDVHALARHGQVQNALFRADRAVAFADRGFVEIDLDPEADAAAMAAALIALHRATPSNYLWRTASRPNV